MHWVFLPGLDGTGRLFGPVREALPNDIEATFVSYANDRVATSAELKRQICAAVDEYDDCVIVAESFSGPLAVAVAAEQNSHVKALVLCASFVTCPPLAHVFSPIASLIFRLPIPSVVVRHFLLGWDAPAQLVSSFRTAVCDVPACVMKSRVDLLRGLNLEALLPEVRVPVLYIRALRDRIVPRHSAIKVQCAISQCDVIDLAGPHLILQRCPAEAIQAIRRFTSNRIA